jgi:hypothetical protein
MGFVRRFLREIVHVDTFFSHRTPIGTGNCIHVDHSYKRVRILGGDRGVSAKKEGPPTLLSEALLSKTITK